MIRYAMVRWLSRASFALLVLVLHSLDLHAQSATRVVVAKYWNCMIEHAAAYGAATSDPVIIFLSLCPTVRRATATFVRPSAR